MEALVARQAASPPLSFVPDYPDPTPAPGEVLIRVHLAGICTTDLEILRGYMSFEGVPGHEFVGTVVEGPKRLKGRRVVGDINCPCGECDMCARHMPGHCRRRSVLGIADRDGAFAELLVLPEQNCLVVPDEVSDEQAVFTEPLAAALQVTKLDQIDPAGRVAVLGAGRLGLLVARVLALHGCQPEVIDRDPQALRRCAQQGMRALAPADLSPKAEHDVIVECTGHPDGLRLALRMCRPRGTIILKSTYADTPRVDLALLVVNELRIVGNRCGPMSEALELLRDGRVAVEDLIGGVYSLGQGVEAFAAAQAPGGVKILLRPGAS